MKWGVYYPYILTIIKIIQIIKNKYNSNNNNINIYGLMIVGGYFWILPGFWAVTMGFYAWIHDDLSGFSHLYGF